MLSHGSGHQETAAHALTDIAPQTDKLSLGIGDHFRPHGAGHSDRPAPAMGKGDSFEQRKKLGRQFDPRMLLPCTQVESQ